MSLRSVAVAIAWACASACSRSGALVVAEAGSAEAAAAPLAVAEASVASDASVDAGDARADLPFVEGVPTSAKAIGHTSVVFKVELSTGKKAAFKPASRRGPVRYKGEIAAYRLGTALGLGNVPRAFFRTFEASAFAAVKSADEMVVANGVVKGALIPWIADLGFLALEQAPLSGEWKQWLRKGALLPEDKRELARQISVLVAFDYVTGNWDRWSGGNVGLEKESGTLLYIDNDGAFFEVAPLEGLARNKRLLAGVDRFSRGFIARVRSLDDESLARAIGDEAPGTPLLSPKALAGVFQRRKELLDVVDAKVKANGEATTFELP